MARFAVPLVLGKPARPVGAASNTLLFLACRILTMLLTIVVLPTPGPPVITQIFDVIAVLMAFCCAAASSTPVFCCTQTSALARSIDGSVSGVRLNSYATGKQCLVLRAGEVHEPGGYACQRLSTKTKAAKVNAEGFGRAVVRAVA